jgi:uncharacterized protein
MRVNLKSLFALPVLVLCAPVAAQNLAVGNIDIMKIDPKSDAPTLMLTIIGTAKAKPDLINISAGITAKSATPAEAMAQNNAAMAKLLAAIKAKGVADKDIQTSSINLGQDYEYVGEKGPVPKGYSASNMVTVQLRDVAQSGVIIDMMAKNGATNINGPSFSIDKPEPLEEKARLDAMAKAQKKAAFYAKAAGYSSARLLFISEGQDTSGGAQYAKMELAQSSAEPATPVQAGEILASVVITVKYILIK